MRQITLSRSTDTRNADPSQDRTVISVEQSATVYEVTRPFRYEVEWYDFERETTRSETFSDPQQARTFAATRG